MRRLVCSALLSLAATVAPYQVAGQSTSAERLATARAQLRAMKLDSAALLLREAVDTIGRPSRDEQVEAWLLLGVVQFYKGDDSGTAADFRQALALEPRLDASGLARYDSALFVLFKAQRGPVPALGDSESSALAVSELTNCVPRCPKNVTPPKLLHLPDITWTPSDLDELPGGRGALLLRYVVTARGSVAPGSIVIVSSNVPAGFQSAVVSALADASFRPARDGGRPIAAMVEEKTELRRELRRSAMPPRMSPP